MYGPHPRRGRLRLLFAAVVAAALAFAVFIGPTAGRPADAHALRSGSDPAAGARLASSPSQVVITFTEQPDLRQSQILVLDTSGKKLAGGPPQPVAGQPASVVRVPVPTALPKGVYTVSWKTISVVDGHLASGAFSFGIGEAPKESTAISGIVKTPGPSEVAVVARWAYLAGLIGMLGFAFTKLVVLRKTQAPRRLVLATAIAWVLAAGGLLGLTQAQRAGAGLSIGNLLSSSIGHAFVLRAVPLVVAGLALLVLRRAGRRGDMLLGMAAAAAMLADAMKSHAAASTSWVWLRVGTQWIHVVAAGIWIGGLAGLLLCLGPLGPGHRGPAARRFSFFAGVCIAAVGLTGTVRALDEVGGWRLLLHTGFGQLILLKIGLFGSLAVLGAINRFRNVAAVERSHRGLRRTGGAEIVAMAMVLAATSLLQNIAPSRTSAEASATLLAPIVVETQDFATTYRLHLTISPGTAGFNDFALRVVDYMSRKPVRADAVSLTFHYPDQPSVGDSTLPLARQPDGTYSGKGANMGLQGHWLLTALVQNGTSSAEVPIDLVTQTPPQPTQAQPFAGSPTIYTVGLAGNRQVQIYIEPLRLGKAEFHATFLDDQGKELHIATFAATAARVPNGAIGKLLTYKNLDNLGHFVADAEVPKGTYSFSVAATTTDGDALGTTITLDVT